MNKMFNKIKKKHGESFAKAIREFHPTILDIPNLDQIIKYSGSDTAIFPYLHSLTLDNESYSSSNECDYIELFNKAGYQVEHTTTVDSFKKYKKYFKKDELLCSFNDIQNRLNNFICLWAVKHNVSEIKRSKNPERQDDYGTSVICIQIGKKSNFISIKNRYNHSVTNPDNTFNSNPDNIIVGLTSAIEKHFNVSFKKDNSISDGFMLIDNKIIKVINEIDGVYFGINCYIIDGELVELNTDYELILDTYILNIKDKKICNLSDSCDCFIDIINELLENNSTDIKGKTIRIGNDYIILNENNQIVGLRLDNVESIGNDFLFHNRELRELSLNNVKTIGNGFLFHNRELRELSLNNVKSFGEYFLIHNRELKELSMNNVKYIGNNFLYNNKELSELSLNSIESIGFNFLFHNTELRELSLNSVESIGNNFLYCNEEMRELSLNNVKYIDNNFLVENRELRKLSLNSIVSIGDYFLYYNKKLRELSITAVKTIGEDFLYYNKELSDKIKK